MIKRLKKLWNQFKRWRIIRRWKKVPVPPRLCNECNKNEATILVGFCSKKNPVIDLPVCDECLDRIDKLYKSTWANSQIILKRIS